MPLFASLSFSAERCCIAGLGAEELESAIFFAGLGGSEGEIGFDSGDGAMTRLVGSGPPLDEGAAEFIAELRLVPDSCRDDDGLAEVVVDALPALPWCSLLELGLLPWRPELDCGLNSCVGRFVGEAVVVLGAGAVEVVLSAAALASNPLRLLLLYRLAASLELVLGRCISSALLARL